MKEYIFVFQSDYGIKEETIVASGMSDAFFKAKEIATQISEENSRIRKIMLKTVNYH